MSVLTSIIEIVAGVAQVIADVVSGVRRSPRSPSREVSPLRAVFKLVVCVPGIYLFGRLTVFLFGSLEPAKGNPIVYALIVLWMVVVALLTMALAYDAIRAVRSLFSGGPPDGELWERAPKEQTRVERARERARQTHLANLRKKAMSAQTDGLGGQNPESANPRRDEDKA